MPSSNSWASLNRRHALSSPDQTETRRPDQELRTRLPHAGRGARGRRPGERVGRDGDRFMEWTSKSRPPSDATACSHVGWSSAASGSFSSTTVPAPSGNSHAALEEKSLVALPFDGPPGRWSVDGPEASRPARRDAGRLGGRVRPDADVGEGGRPRPQPLRVHHVDGRARACREAGSSAPPTRSVCTRSKTGSTSTTSTPRSSTSWGSTTPSSSIATRDAPSGRPSTKARSRPGSSADRGMAMRSP